MDSKQFFDKVSEMRDTQKSYFKTRFTDHLKKSKALEREIDKEIDRVKRLLEDKKNPKLF